MANNIKNKINEVIKNLNKVADTINKAESQKESLSKQLDRLNEEIGDIGAEANKVKFNRTNKNKSGASTGGGLAGKAAGKAVGKSSGAAGGIGKIAGMLGKSGPILLAVTAVVGAISKTVKLLYNTVKKNLPVVSKSVTSKNRLEGKNVNEQRTKGIQLIEKIKAALDSIGEFLAGKLLDFLGSISEAYYYVKDFFSHFGDYALAFLQDLPQAIYNAFVGSINLFIDQINNLLWVLDQIAEFFTGDSLGFRAPKIEYAKLEHVDAEIDKASKRIEKEHADSKGLDNALDTVSTTTLEQILVDLASAVKDLGLTTKDAKTFANKVVNKAASLVNSGMFDNLKDASDALKDAIINENYSSLSGMGINDKNVLAMMTKLYPDYDYSGNTVYTESAMAGMREAAIEKLIGLSSEQLSALTEEGTILSNIEQGLAESLFGKETISGVNASSGTYDKNGNFVLETDDEVQNEIKTVNDYLSKILDNISGKGTSSSNTTINNFTGENKVQKKLGKTLDTVWNEMEKRGKTHSNKYDPGVGWDPNGYDMLHRTGDGSTTTSNNKDKSGTSKNKKKGFLERLFNTDWKATAKNMAKTYKSSSFTDNLLSTAKNVALTMNPITAIPNAYRLWDKYNVQKNDNSSLSSNQQSRNTLNWINNKANEGTKSTVATDKTSYNLVPAINSFKNAIENSTKLFNSSNKRVNSSSTKQQVDVKVTVSDNRTSATASYNKNVNSAMSSASTSRASSTRRR
jgi:hypothetical protein